MDPIKIKIEKSNWELIHFHYILEISRRNVQENHVSQQKVLILDGELAIVSNNLFL